MTGPRVRDARAEAQEVAGPEWHALVLEPSPPAVEDGEWFADDPVVAESTDDRPLVSPVLSPVPGRGDLTWDVWLAEHPERREWAAQRWLGGWRRLPNLPASFVETRLALHRLATDVVSPARQLVNGKIGLRWTLGGFGTPFFGEDEQVRVEGLSLVRQRGESAELEEAPVVDAAGAAFLGEWYGFGTSVLEELRAEPETTEASRVQIWPEHFDVAFECMSEGEHRRAGFGASPGDEAVPEPYLYVVPWYFDDVPASSCWNADSFSGAIVALSELADAPDQRAAALDFLRECRAVLDG